MHDSFLRSRSSRFPRWALALLAALLVSIPLGVNASLELSPSADSPATGHAEVVTQGIVEIPAGQEVWRVAERTARPRGEAIPARKVIGFVFANEESILLADFDDSGLTNAARLAPGEAALVTDTTRTVRASLTDQSTEYLALELVPADGVDDVGSGNLLFASSPFATQGGEHDVDLVRDVLAPGESTTIAGSDQVNVLVAIEGVIDVIPDDGSPTRLEAGESVAFTGEFEVEAAQSEDADWQTVAALTADLAQDQQNQSSFLVAVIGEEIPPPPVSTPAIGTTATPSAASALVTSSTTTPGPEQTPRQPTSTTAAGQPTPTLAPGQPTATSTAPNVNAPTDTPTALPTIARPPTFTPTALPSTDSDFDGIVDIAEPDYQTDPLDSDTDDDALVDGAEVFNIGTDPLEPDTDGDGLTDGDEVNRYGTNPLSEDTDGDGFSDGYEVSH